MTTYITDASGRKTRLERLQKEIDRCNRKSGCDAKCAPRTQKTCPLLRAHAARIAECLENNLPMTAW